MIVIEVLAPFIDHEGKKVSTSWAQDARNRLSMTLELDLNIPEIKEIFLGLIKESDILWKTWFGWTNSVLMMNYYLKPIQNWSLSM